MVGTEDEYTYNRHLYRTLLTNLYPADYDYEAPRQTLRHRLYATLHSADRWAMQACCACRGTHRHVSDDPADGAIASDPCSDTFGCCGCAPVGAYACASGAVGAACCVPLFVATGCCCCGWLQGLECGKCRSPAALEACGFGWEAYWRCACGLPLACHARFDS